MSLRSGHRLVPHTADCIIETWGPDRAACLTEALLGLLEGFAEVGSPLALGLHDADIP
jgi:protein archease